MKKKTGSNILFAVAVLALVACLGILFCIHKTKHSSIKRMKEEAAKVEAPIELVARGTEESVAEEVVEESVGPEDLSGGAATNDVVESSSTTPYEEPLVEDNTPLVEVGVEVESY